MTKYTVLEAADGEEGVRIATNEIPDLIISDVMMPVKDGFACCREIRERQETAHIPILMLTAKAEDADVLQGSYSGADDYMMKPFNRKYESKGREPDSSARTSETHLYQSIDVETRIG